VALEEAGISLQAEGFTDYIKKLDRIDKAQQEIFNVTSQKTVQRSSILLKKLEHLQSKAASWGRNSRGSKSA
jgi:hypothetical protein